MSAVLELHPDELLDKDARGELTAEEETRLTAHLAHCSACRLEREAARDFRMELAAGDSDLELESLVTRALAGAKTSEPEETSEEPPQSEDTPRVVPIAVRRRRRMSPMFVAAACAVFSVVGIAAAAQWTSVFHAKTEGTAAGPNVTSKSNTLAPQSGSALPSPPSSIVGVATQEDPALVVPSPDPVPSAPPSAEGPKLPVHVSATSGQAAPVHEPIPEPAVSVDAPVAPPAVAAVPVTPDAATLFAEANRAKARGQHADAVRGYRDLQRNYPGSPEARLANAIVGRLLLDDGNALDAVTSLDRYLQSGDGALREEALAARATALSRLGRHDEELATWKQLLQSYPHSMHAKRAEARLAETSPR